MFAFIRARFGGSCKRCRQPFVTGDPIAWSRELGTYHNQCAPTVAQVREEEPPPAIEASLAEESDLEVPAPPGLALKPYQRAGVAFLQPRRGAILADEMGLGKTIQVAGYLNVSPAICSVCVVCPKSLAINWARELAKWDVHGRPFARVGERGWEAALVVIATFEQAKAYVELLAGREWDLLVVDEAHRIKNKKRAMTREQKERAVAAGKKVRKLPVQRTAAVHAIKARALRIFALSGTPIENKPAEIFPLLSLVAPDVWDPGGKGWMPFARRYCAGRFEEIRIKGGETRRIFKSDGASNLEELQLRLRATCLLRRLKRDVLKELPAKVRTIVELDPDPPTQRAIFEEAAHIRHQVAGDYETVLAGLASKNHRFSELARQRSELALRKAPLVAEHVRDLLEDGSGKVLVGYWHTRMAMHVIAALQSAGVGVVRVSGDQGERDRQRAVDDFQRDPSIRVLVGQLDAAGVGLTLTAAETVVLAELPWTPSQASQFEDRAHRMGQAKSVLVQHLVYRGSLDAHMARQIVDKQRVMEAALDW